MPGGIAAIIATLIAAAGLAAPAPAAAAAACPNEAFRAGSPWLADCRAYELVSPVDMNGNGVEQVFGVSPDGDAVAYGTVNIFGDEAPSSLTGKWIARRGADWVTRTLNPPTPGRAPTAYDEPVLMDLADDFSTGLLGTRYPVSPLDQAPYRNFTASGNADIYKVWPGGAVEWLSHGPTLPETEYIDRGFSGASADLSQVLFQTREPLTRRAEGSTAANLYERDGARLRLVNLDENGLLLPGGAATGRGDAASASFYNGTEYSQGSNAQGQPYDPSAVSRDGSRVFFTAPLEPASAPRQLYVRIGGAETVLVSECRFGACLGSEAPGGAMFLIAAPDGSSVTFYSPSQLTEAAPATGGIYRFDVDSRELTFLTPLDISTGPGFHRGGVVAASEGGEYLYLCEGGTELVVFHDGEVTPIAPIPCDAAQAQSGATEPRPARSGATVAGAGGITQGEPRLTPDAGYLFTTRAGPAEIGNSYPNEGHAEVYYYDARAALLRCLSCRPDGAPARADSFLNHEAKVPESFASIPTPASSGIPVRNLSADGKRAFFVSEEALVPGDVNEQQDVYEWELPGTGDCTTASPSFVPASGGCLALVSSGDSPVGAVLEGASASGDDVFIATFSSLVPINSSTELHLYDARAGGGVAAQFAGRPPACDSTAGCRGEAPPAPLAGTAASAHFSGPGDAPARVGCASLRKRAQALRAQARRARAAARRAGKHNRPGRAKRMKRRSKRLARRAGRLARRAKQCAGSERGAGR